MTVRPRTGDSVARKCSEMGRPVAAWTSRARMMRTRSAVADLAGVLRIDRFEPAEERVEPFLAGFRLERRAHRRVPAGAWEKAVQEGLEIEAGAAGHDGEPAPGRDAPGGGQGVADEVRGRVLDLGVDDVDEMMGDAAPRLRIGLVGADVEAAVDLDGVAADHFAVEAPGQVDGDAALADRGRPEDDDEDGGFRFQFR